jgi:hypothetical protein
MEKMQAKQLEADEDRDYANQTEAVTRMRGLLEDEATNKRNAAVKQNMEDNQRLA